MHLSLAVWSVFYRVHCLRWWRNIAQCVWGKILLILVLYLVFQQSWEALLVGGAFSNTSKNLHIIIILTIIIATINTIMIITIISQPLSSQPPSSLCLWPSYVHHHHICLWSYRNHHHQNYHRHFHHHHNYRRHFDSTTTIIMTISITMSMTITVLSPSSYNHHDHQYNHRNHQLLSFSSFIDSDNSQKSSGS